jgi:hypothetical protein
MQLAEWIKQKLFLVRWGASARNWPVKRFLPTTDLDLSESEQAELTLGIHGWRQLIPWYIARFGGDQTGKQIYCFGVAHGSTVHTLVAGYRNRGLEVPHLHLFDSFEGLPAEEAGVSAPSVWTVGAYAAPRAKLEQSLREINLPQDSHSIHEGWFNETLDAKLVSSGAFKAATYVDIDADLYNSTRDVLDFLFFHKLIGPGTLIGYDDWGDSDLWTAGESRAHKEVLAKYGAQCAQLFSWGDVPLIKKLFLVVSIAGAQI